MNDDDRRERRIARVVRFGYWLIRLLGATWRIRVRNDGELRQRRATHEPVIFSLWHGHLLPLLYHHRHQGVAVLISEHGDGEIIARIAVRLGYRTVRGSTSRGAARALLAMVREVEQGHDLAITPDGPRGPARSIAPGTLIVAQRSGAPILPIVAGVRRAWRLKCWDGFVIPHPFARIDVTYAPLLFVDRAGGREAIEDTSRLRDGMEQAERSADAAHA
jgi:lysophospholipid acyltransferase (LPLAT)-like uncharacterized protein